MENASKALIMAGSILIAILIIGLLVYGYNQLSDTEQIREDAEYNDKATEYMRQFEQFNRTVYGSELLSLANLQTDYNESETVDGLGYGKIEITIDTDGVTNSPYFAAGKNVSLESIAQDRQKIEEELKQYESSRKNYNNRSVKYYSQKTNREIAIEFGMDPPTDMPDYDIADGYLLTNSTTAKLLNEINEYKNLTTIYNEFRIGKKFRCTKVIYNDNNGRLESMHFEEL